MSHEPAADKELDVAELDHHLHYVARPEFWPGLVGQQVHAVGAALTPSPGGASLFAAAGTSDPGGLPVLRMLRGGRDAGTGWSGGADANSATGPRESGAGTVSDQVEGRAGSEACGTAAQGDSHYYYHAEEGREGRR